MNAFFIEDDELLETYINIWNRFRIALKILDCKPIYNKNILETKIMDENYFPKL